jgi:hypothetical protein
MNDEEECRPLTTPLDIPEPDVAGVRSKDCMLLSFSREFALFAEATALMAVAVSTDDAAGMGEEAEREGKEDDIIDRKDIGSGCKDEEDEEVEEPDLGDNGCEL